jgi:serine phosphatase RsbU (regulator of sigma subunit)
LAICRFDPRSHEIEFLGAGHEGTLVRADGSFERLQAATIPLGIQKLPTFRTTKVAVSKGALILLCTDGFHEALSSDDEEFGMERLVQAVIANENAELEQLLQLCVKQVADFSGRTIPVDDQTAVVLSIQ